MRLIAIELFSSTVQKSLKSFCLIRKGENTFSIHIILSRCKQCTGRPLRLFYNSWMEYTFCLYILISTVLFCLVIKKKSMCHRSIMGSGNRALTHLAYFFWQENHISYLQIVFLSIYTHTHMYIYTKENKGRRYLRHSWKDQMNFHPRKRGRKRGFHKVTKNILPQRMLRHNFFFFFLPETIVNSSTS